MSPISLRDPPCRIILTCPITLRVPETNSADADLPVEASPSPGTAQSTGPRSVVALSALPGHLSGPLEASGKRKLKRQARLWEEGDIERFSDFTTDQRRALEDEERARLQKQADHDASATTQRTFLGSIVTFGAGLQVLGFITGFEACVVRVSGLPVDASDKDIFALFTQQGGTAVDQARLYLAHNEVLSDGTRDVRMVMDIEWGRALSAGLQGIEFRDHRLSFEVQPYTPPGGMISLVREAFISWRPISTCYVVSYSSETPIDIIDQKVKQLNGYTYFGRRLCVERLAPPPGHPENIALESIRIRNLPTSITYAEVFSLAGPHASSVRATSTPSDLEVIRSALSSSGCTPSDIVSLEPVSITDGALEGMPQFCARFSSEDIVTRVYDYLNGRTLLGGLFFDVSFSVPKYAIAIPAAQYAAQLSQWVDLKHSIRDYDRTQCSLVKLRIRDTSDVRLTVTGTDPQAVGAMKIRAEALAAGEKLVGWHDRFRERSISAFISGVMAKSGAYICVDRRLRQISLYGSSQAISSARTMITHKIARLSTRPFIIKIPSASMQSFVAQGLPELRELLGSENVHFDPAANRHHVSRRYCRFLAVAFALYVSMSSTRPA
ncbi:hypothetical protein PENSPDRAFT_760120 [Peniophora sp. CONT]|nr:hypothetical protein PENSPDRAFT_760120 [Peniophora sp. CONT]